MRSEFLRFAVVGCLGFVVDAGLVLVLIKAGASPVLARIPALGAAVFTTWILNRALTFRVSTTRNRGEIVRYVIVALSSAALNFLIYTALVVRFELWPLTAVAISTIALLFYSFIGYRRFAFRLPISRRQP